MTNDELNKFTKALDMVNQLLDREEKLQEIIKMQREAIDFYADKKNWDSCCHGSYEVGIAFDDHEKEQSELRWVKYQGGKRARATQSAINEKLKEMGLEI